MMSRKSKNPKVFLGRVEPSPAKADYDEYLDLLEEFQTLWEFGD